MRPGAGSGPGVAARGRVSRGRHRAEHGAGEICDVLRAEGGTYSEPVRS